MKKNAWFSSAGTFAVCPATLLRDSRLNPRQVQVFLALASHANPQTGVCYLSRERIAEIVGLSQVADVSRAISVLVEAGWVSSQQRFNQTNIYTVHLSKSAVENQRVVTDRQLPDEQHAKVLQSRGVAVPDASLSELNVHDLVQILDATGYMQTMTYLDLAQLRLDCLESGDFSEISRSEIMKHYDALRAMQIVTQAQVSAIQNA